MKRLTATFFFLATLMTAAVAQQGEQAGQGTSILSAAISGAFGPTTLHIEDLPEHVSAVELTLTGFSGLEDLEMGGFSNMGSRSSEAKQRLFAYLTCYWTTGNTVRWKDAEYMVAYRSNRSDLQSAMMEQSNPPFEHTPAVPTMRLILINVSQIVSMTPRSDLSKADWIKVNAELQAPKNGGNGNRTAAISNLKQIALAAMMYSSDADDMFPDAHSASQAEKALQPYCKNTEIFKTQNPNGGRILFNVNLAGISETALDSPQEIPLFYDSIAWPDGGRPVAFADGHTKYVSAGDWDRVAAQLNRKYQKQLPVPKPKPEKKPKTGKKR